MISLGGDLMIDNSEDICIWADGSWCYRCDLEEYLNWMSDDFSILEEDSVEWRQLVEPDN